MNNVTYKVSYENGGSMYNEFYTLQETKTHVIDYMCNPLYGGVKITRIESKNVSLKELLF